MDALTSSDSMPSVSVMVHWLLVDILGIAGNAAIIASQSLGHSGTPCKCQNIFGSVLQIPGHLVHFFVN